MASDQAVQFANFLGALRARFSNPDLDLPTVRDVTETMHLATKNPRGRQLCRGGRRRSRGALVHPRRQ